MCTHGLQAAAGLPRAAAGSVSCFCRASKVAPVHAGSQGGFPSRFEHRGKGHLMDFGALFGRAHPWCGRHEGASSRQVCKEHPQLSGLLS